jgi:drug/metabolite transporter (DMT)-like permease
MHQKNTKKAIVLALLTVLMWSTVAVPFKIGLHYFPVLHFQFISVTTALVVMVILLSTTQQWNQFVTLSTKQYVGSFFTGLINPLLYYMVLFKAYSLLPAQMAQSLNYTWPLMLVVLSVPLLGQKLRLSSVIALLVGLIGVYLVASQGNPWQLAPANGFGIILAVGSSGLWALYWIINTKSKTPPMVALFLNFFAAWLVLLLLVMVNHTFESVPLKAWIAVIYAGLFEMGIPFFVWLMALKFAPRSDSISHLVYLSPFISLIFIYFVLTEPIYITTLAGLGFIVLAAVMPKGKPVKPNKRATA